MNPWLIRAAETLAARGGAVSVHPHLASTALREAEGSSGCSTHPEGHQHTLIPVNAPMIENTNIWGFDDFGYLDTPGYCMGDDDVSRTLRLYGQWEPAETRAFVAAVAKTSGIVIDFGAQIGWYTTIAARMGRDVLAIEPIGEHVELIKENAKLHGVADKVTIAQCWVDSFTAILDEEDAPPIAMVKIDLEGNDQWAVRSLARLIVEGNVAHLLVEISPVFNDSYPDLVNYLLDHGYSGVVVNPWQPFTLDDYEAVVAQAPQVDMMFSRNP